MTKEEITMELKRRAGMIAEVYNNTKGTEYLIFGHGCLLDEWIGGLSCITLRTIVKELEETYKIKVHYYTRGQIDIWHL